ncbi:helix-turn-helix domain-containing protein [Nocardia amamiensis]
MLPLPYLDSAPVPRTVRSGQTAGQIATRTGIPRSTAYSLVNAKSKALH